MNKINSFKDLIVWQKAYQFVKKVYSHTKGFPDDEKFGLTSQIRRASVSVASNIVEGFARRGVKDSLSFYNIANASLEEVKFQLMLSVDFGYITSDEYIAINYDADEVGRLLRGWSNSRRPFS